MLLLYFKRPFYKNGCFSLSFRETEANLCISKRKCSFQRNIDKFNINEKLVTHLTAIGRTFKKKEEKITVDTNAISIIVILYILKKV